jgi:coproporphyrinogen III oxidase
MAGSFTFLFGRGILKEFMDITFATSESAAQVLRLVESLQARFVRSLEERGGTSFSETRWGRDNGRHGGGVRYGINDSDLLGRASVNVSQVHYDDEPGRSLGSASALSTIVHPAHPSAPSIHIHLSWTEMKTGKGYWRMMADLNPAIPSETVRRKFLEALSGAAPNSFAEASEQGDRYFYIPALDRCRGVAHFYLESYNSGRFEDDYALANAVGETAIDTYMEILRNLPKDAPIQEREQAEQLAYHSLYFFQVLTLDRGTTAGLLVHNQNDIGILGSLPARVDKDLLRSWRSRMPIPQDLLLDRILEALPDGVVCRVDHEVKQRLADAVRDHYSLHPEALDLQASGNSAPPTVENHRPEQC